MLGILYQEFNRYTQLAGCKLFLKLVPQAWELFDQMGRRKDFGI